MRLLIQRVAEARVDIAGQTVGRIGSGLLVLQGIGHSDDTSDLDWLVPKLLNLRIFTDADDKMNLSVQDVQGGLLVVSQFTLHASTRKGNRPSFTDAAPPAHAIPLYEGFVQRLRATYTSGPVETGQFGADMQVHLLNDGPVTIWIDSRNRE